jgi:thiol:disulfide interchange protein DsbD
MGFLEIAAAVKFLSNVDLVWGAAYKAGPLNYGLILTREVVLGIWVAIALVIAAYLLGLFRFRHDAPLRRLSVVRVVFASAFILLGVYLSLGVFGKKLGELESFLPPRNKDSALNILGDHNEELDWITNDYAAALEKARAENRKVFIDFTGYTCTNCRWMEANMFVRPEIRAAMSQYVLVSLYTDGEGEIYERQQALEQEMFGTVALPIYAIVDSTGRPVATFPGLTRKPQEFLDFLRKGF